MEFYDVAEEGFHTPLTKTQISELFHAGRLSRNHPCKLAAKKEWRTIDELFPLLKYDFPTHSCYEVSDAHSAFSRNQAFIILMATLAAATLALIGYFSLRNGSREPGHLPITYPSQSNAGAPLSQPVITGTHGIAPSFTKPTQPRVDYSQQQARLAQERSDAERRQREQASLADQVRTNAERRRQEADKAAGTDYHVPLDEDYQVPVGGGWVRVKIHDNDVTSFDAWINGAHYREIQKEKGITHSRTDETFIYSSGRASLYYVWEISGRLNHCMLRVRDN